MLPDVTNRRAGVTIRILRAPLTHFLLIGGLLFSITGPGAVEQSRARKQERPTIAFTAADIEQLTSDWSLQHGSPPNPEQREALIQEAIDEEVLHREGRRSTWSATGSRFNRCRTCFVQDETLSQPLRQQRFYFFSLRVRPTRRGGILGLTAPL